MVSSLGETELLFTSSDGLGSIVTLFTILVIYAADVENLVKLVSVFVVNSGVMVMAQIYPG